MNLFTPWVEKYRPQLISEMIGHDNITQRLQSYLTTKNLPNLLFSGAPGSGKTTAALALARELFGENFQQSFAELNASDERGIDIVRGKIKDFARTLPVSDVPFKILLLDEADSLTADAQQALRRTMETYASNTRFILSCNYSSRIIEPIQSRCSLFRFTPLSDVDLTKLVQRVVQTESLEISQDGIDAVLYVAEGDARKALNCLQGAASMSSNMASKITSEIIYSVSSRARPKEINEMLTVACSGNFLAARKILDKLMVEHGMSGEDIVVQLFQEVTRSKEIEDKIRLLLVEKIGECDFRLSEGANERIQVEALLAGFGTVKGPL